MEDVRAAEVLVVSYLSYPILSSPLAYQSTSSLCRQTWRDTRGRQVPQIVRVRGTCSRGWARPTYPSYRLVEQRQHADERIRGLSLCIDAPPSGPVLSCLGLDRTTTSSQFAKARRGPTKLRYGAYAFPSSLLIHLAKHHGRRHVLQRRRKQRSSSRQTAFSISSAMQNRT
jgi:hypothetical protein